MFRDRFLTCPPVRFLSIKAAADERAQFGKLGAQHGGQDVFRSCTTHTQHRCTCDLIKPAVMCRSPRSSAEQDAADARRCAAASYRRDHVFAAPCLARVLLLLPMTCTSKNFTDA